MAENISFILEGGLRISPAEISRLQRELTRVEEQMKLRVQVTGGNTFKGLSNDVSQFSSYLDRANQRVIAFTSSVGILYATVRVFKDIVNSTIDVNKALADINSVMKLSTANLDKFTKDLLNTARATSSSFTEAAEAAKTFSRQGISVEETLRRTKDALILTRISGLDTTQAVKQLTESIAIFAKSGLSTRDIVQSLSTVSANFAVSSEDLTDAFSRVGSTAASIGISFNQLIGIISAAKQSTQRDGAAIGTALNSIFIRFQPQDTIKSLERLGIVIRDAAGNALPTIGILNNLARSYDGLSDAAKVQIDKLVGGSRQINILKGSLTDLSNINGTYAQTQKLLSGNIDNVTDRLKIQNESISALIENFVTANKQIGSNIGNLSFAPLLKTIVGTGTDNPITKALEDASGHAETQGGKFAEGILRGIGNSLLFGLAPILAVAGSKIVSRTYSTLFSDIKNQAFNDTGNRQLTIQEKIVALYNRGDDALRRQLSTMTALVEQSNALASGLNSRQRSTGVIPAISQYFPQGKSLNGRQVNESISDILYNSFDGIPNRSLNDYRNEEMGIAASKLPNRSLSSFRDEESNRLSGRVSNFTLDEFRNKEMAKVAGKIPNVSAEAIRRQEAEKFFKTHDKNPQFPGYLKQIYEDPVRSKDPINVKTFSEIETNTQARIQAQAAQQQAIISAAETRANQAFQNQTGKQAKIMDMIDNRANSKFQAQARKQAGIFDNVESNATSRHNTQLDARDAANENAAAQIAALKEENRNHIIYQQQSAVFNKRGSGLMGYFGTRQGDINAIAGLRSGPANEVGLAALQARRASNIQNAGIAASFILPLAGGALDQWGGGVGGTGRGIGVGGASGALNGAGLGAGVGSFFGPAGTMIGTAAGGLIGSLVGAFAKITKSLEEVTEEITSKNNKIKADFQKAADVFTIQSQLAEVVKGGGDSRKIKELQNNFSSSLGGIQDKTLKNLIIGGINSTTGQQDVIDYQNRVVRKESLADAFRTAGSTLLSESAITKGIGASAFGGIGFTAPISAEAQNQIAQAVGRALAGLSEKQVTTLGAVNESNPKAAFEFLAKRSGLSSSEIKDLQPAISTSTSGYYKNLQGGISKALAGKVDEDILESSTRTTSAIVDFSEKLRILSEGFQYAAKAAQILTDGYEKVTDSLQKTILAVANVTTLSKISRSGQFDEANIATNFAGQRAQTTIGTQSALTLLLSKSGINDPQTVSRISTARTQADFQKLFDNGDKSGIADKKDNDDYLKILREAVSKLKEISLAEVASLRVATLTNQLLQVQEKTRERDNFRANSRFDDNTFADIQYQNNLGNISRKGFPNSRGYQNQALLTEQGQLDSLGIPQTDTALSSTQFLQKERAQFTLSQILANRLHRKVGTRPEDLVKAANSLNLNVEGNESLQSRVLKAVESNQYTPEQEITNIRKKIGGSPAEFSKALTGSGLGSTDTFLATGFNDLTNAIIGADGTNSLLEDIRDALISQAFKNALGAKEDNLIKAKTDVLAAEQSGDPTKIALAKSRYENSKARSKETVVLNEGDLPALETFNFGNTSTTLMGEKITSMSPFKSSGSKPKDSSNGPFSGFGTGFTKSADIAKQGLESYAAIGSQVAASLESNFNRVWDSILTGSLKGRDAFKGFLAGIAGDASKAFANQAFRGLFSSLFGSDGTFGKYLAPKGNEDGGIIHRAGGGAVPALLTGGEFYFSPKAARNIGYDRLNSMNRGYAGGGMVSGGSGLRDDVHANLAPGSFILKKSAVQKLGPSYLQSIATGAVRRAGGGMINHYDGGGMAFKSTGHEFDMNTSLSMTNTSAGTAAGSNMAGAMGSLQGSAYGALASLALLLIEKWLQPKGPHAWSNSEITSHSAGMRGDQAAQFNTGNGHAFLQRDGQGGSSVINYNGESPNVTNYSANGGPILAMQRFSEGGGVGDTAPVPVGGAVGSNNNHVGVQITIHNNGQGGTSSNTQTNNKTTDFSSREFANRLGTQVEAKVKEVLNNEMRAGGIFTQQRRYFPSAGQ